MEATAAAPTRAEIIDDAIKIARAQGAVHEASHFWEDPETGEDLLEAARESGDKQWDPGNCRVCIEGALMLASVRRGLGRHACYLVELDGGPLISFTTALERSNQTLSDISDNTDALVRALEALR